MNDLPPANEPPPYPGLQPYQGQQPYGGQGQPYPPPAPQTPYGAGTPPNHPQATASLVMGIVSVAFVVMCCLPLGPVAWIMGSKAVKEIDANPTMWSGRGNANAGKILGIVATGLFVFFVVVFIATFAFMVAMESANPGYIDDL